MTPDISSDSIHPEDLAALARRFQAIDRVRALKLPKVQAEELRQAQSKIMEALFAALKESLREEALRDLARIKQDDRGQQIRSAVRTEALNNWMLSGFTALIFALPGLELDEQGDVRAQLLAAARGHPPS